MPKIVDHEERRAQIVAAMWRLVKRDGFGAVTVRSVAAEAGLAPTTVAEEFPSQIEMLIQAVQELSAAINGRIARAGREEVSAQMLVELAMLAVPVAPTRRRQSSVWIALMDAASRDHRAAQALIGVNDLIRSAIYSHLLRAQAAGIIASGHDVQLLTTHLHALIDGISAQVISTSRPSAREIRTVFSAFFQNLA